MLTSAATQSVACEHSSRLCTRMIAFSSTLPIERSPSLRTSPWADWLVRGCTPPRPSTSVAPWGCDHAGQAELCERRLRSTIEKPLVTRMDGILVALRDHRRRGALEDALQDAIVLAGEPSRLRNPRLDPASIGRLDPVRARAGHDTQPAVAPELSLRAEAVGRHDNRDQSCCADRSEAGAVSRIGTMGCFFAPRRRSASACFFCSRKKSR